jgi:hypothetical protein
MSFGSLDIVDVKIILQRDALANLLDYLSKTTHRLYAGADSVRERSGNFHIL